MDNFLIVDGNSLINRAFYAIAPLSSKDGSPTNAVMGFANMLLKAIDNAKPKYIAIAFDLPYETFRHKLFDQYKGERKKAPEELILQIQTIKEMLKKMNIYILEKKGYEADDIIGTLATSKDTRNIIISGDKDVLQLINNNTEVWITKKGISDIVVVTQANIKEIYGYNQDEVTIFKGLCGDKSDNIKGVESVGEKTALSLLNTYGTLDNIYLNINNIKGKLKERLLEDKESAYLSQQLATICTHVPLNYNLQDFELIYPFSLAVQDFFLSYGMHKLAEKDIYINKVEKNLVIDKRLEIKCGYDNFESILEEIDFAKCISLNLETKSISTKDKIYVFEESLWKNALKSIIAKKIQIVDYDIKELQKKLIRLDNAFFIENYFDIKLAVYIMDYYKAQLHEDELLQEYKQSNIFELMDVLKKEIIQNNLEELYYNIELPLVKILFDMQEIGFCVDEKFLNDIKDEHEKNIRYLQICIYKSAGKEFNINSPKQLLQVLFEDLNIPYPKKFKKNSTNIDVLEEIIDEHPIIKLIIEYRAKFKALSTYIMPILRKVQNGYIKTEFKQTLSSTGRLVSVEPNLQNIPFKDDNGRLLRKLFIARKNCFLISADYSQIELRLLAHFSNDPVLVEAFKNGEDIHLQTAMQVFDAKKEDVTKQMRRAAKAVNFGIIYGISEYGLAKNLGVDVSIAKTYIDSYFNKYKKVKEYLDKSSQEALFSGQAGTMFNRRRKIPELNSHNKNIQNFGKRAAMNMPLQGTAADIIKIAMIKVYEGIKRCNAKLLLQIHDELIVEVEKSKIEETEKIIKDCMENATVLSVPIVVDISHGETWYDCK